MKTCRRGASRARELTSDNGLKSTGNSLPRGLRNNGNRIRYHAMSIPVQIAMMIVAALFEVGGDALIRRGITGGGIALIVVGFFVLGTYGVVVNLIGLDFSRLLGAYVGWFALVSVLFGRFVFGDRISINLWVGLALVLTGSLVIQTGSRAASPSLSEAARKVGR